MNYLLFLDAQSTFSDAGYPKNQHHQSVADLKAVLETKAPWQASAFDRRCTGVRRGAWERPLSLIWPMAFHLDYLTSHNGENGEPPYWGFHFLLYPDRNNWERFAQSHAEILRLNNAGVYRALEISAIALVVLVFPFKDYDLPDERKGEIVQDVDRMIDHMEKGEEFLSTQILHLGDFKRSVAPLPY